MNIQLEPKQEKALRKLAEEAGIPAEVYAGELLKEAISVHENGKKREATQEPSTTFHDCETNLDSLFATQCVKPVERFEDLLGDFWPGDETADDFIEAVHNWRREGKEERSK